MGTPGPLPLLTYSALGGLRQDPVRAAKSSAEARICRIGSSHLNSLPTSVFDLPDHLSPKADPALIGRDEQHFATMAESLDQLNAELSERLAAERRAPGGKGRQAMDRDEEIRRLTGRLRTLSRY